MRTELVRAGLPFIRQHPTVRHGFQRHPVRTVDAMRPADSSAHRPKFLPATGPIRGRLPPGIAAHPEFRIKARFHELFRRVRPQWIVQTAERARNECTARVVGHSPRRADLFRTERSRQAPLSHESPKPGAKSRQFGVRGRGAAILPEKSPKRRAHHLREFPFRLVHERSPAQRFTAVNDPTGPNNCHGHTSIFSSTVLVANSARYDCPPAPVSPIFTAFRFHPLFP